MDYNYIKCGLCGELTELKDETVTRCSSCNLIFDKPYDEWKIKNPEKSFEDYKRAVCMSSKRIPFYKTQKKVIRWIGIGILICFIAFLKYYSRSTTPDLIEEAKIDLQSTDQKWSKQTFGLTGLSLETPYSFNKVDYPLNNEQKQSVVNVDLYQCEHNDLAIIIQCVDYTSLNADENLKSIMENALNGITTKEGLSDIKSSVDSLFNGKIKGYSVLGSFKKNEKDYSFHLVIFGKDKRLWQVISSYLTRDNLANETTLRLFKSIEINEK